MDYVGAARAVRERAQTFVDFASDPDRLVRRAAIPGLGLFLDDTERATTVLRALLAEETGVVERLLVMEAMATLAIRLTAAAHDAKAWFAELSADPEAEPTIRLAAVVQRARCAPQQVNADTVSTVIGLLRQIPPTATTPDQAWRNRPNEAAPATERPPQIAAAFADMQRESRVHSPTTDLLRTLHQVLVGRVPERAALLAEQLRGPDPGTRLDAIRMSGELMKRWRGEYTSLITLVAEHLDVTHHEIAAEAAAVLDACHPIAERAREALAEYVAAHGPDVWAAPQPHLRRAYQEAVVALARLRDVRAVPSVLTALDSGVDEWRAVQVAGCLPQAAEQLVPRLCEHLRRVDVTLHQVEMSARSILSALAALGDPVALPLITETLATAQRHEQGRIMCSALQALGAFGPAAAPALDTVRPLIAATDGHVRLAAVGALWAVSRDQQEIMPLLDDLLTQPTFWVMLAADILGEIGPPAAVALPRLHERLTDSYEWVRVHCAAAIWDIGGETQAATVLDILLQAWQQNPATANHVVTCLNSMAPAAEPALPQLIAELARPERGGRLTSIDNDEELQRLGRAIVARLTGTAEPQDGG